MRSRLVTSGSTDSSGPNLITLEALKLELGITDDSEDATLTARIERWSRMFSEWCGRPFAFAEGVETFTFDTNEAFQPRQPLLLSLYPVVDVVSVVTNGSAVDTYELDAANGLLWIPNSYWSGTIEVTYSGGYQPDEYPGGLVEAIIQQISDLRTTSDRDPAIQTVAHGDTRVSYFQNTSSSGSMSSTVIDLLRPFKRPVLA